MQCSATLGSVNEPVIFFSLEEESNHTRKANVGRLEVEYFLNEMN